MEGVTHVLNVATGIEIDRGDSGVVEERVELLDIPEQCILKSETDVKLGLVVSNLNQTIWLTPSINQV